jgi:hypothetical protein
MLAFQQQGRLAHGYITRHLNHSRRHHMGHHSGYGMLRLRRGVIVTEHRLLAIRRDSLTIREGPTPYGANQVYQTG